MYGPCDPDRQVGVVSFNFKSVAPEEVAYVLDEMYGIMVRAGLAMFLNEITVTFIEPCWADSGKVRLKAQLSANIGFLLPYLNAVLPGAIYSQGSDNLTLMKEGSIIVLYPDRLTLAKARSTTHAYQILDWVQQVVNQTYARQSEIEPSYELWRRPSIPDIIKSLPRSSYNCRQCGEPTCLAFAAKVWLGERALEQCPPFLRSLGQTHT